MDAGSAAGATGVDVSVDHDLELANQMLRALAENKSVNLGELARTRRRADDKLRAERAEHAREQRRRDQERARQAELEGHAKRLGISVATWEHLVAAEAEENKMYEEMQAEGYPVEHRPKPLTERTEEMIGWLKRDIAEKGKTSLVSGKRWVDYDDPLVRAVSEAIPENLELVCEYDLYRAEEARTKAEAASADDAPQS